MTTVLISGASSGLGAGCARQFAARGADLALVARDKTRLKATADELRSRYGIETEVLVADLLQKDGCARVEARLTRGRSAAPGAHVPRPRPQRRDAAGGVDRPGGAAVDE
ncbi:hypothetical protein DB35_13260 [Streptomyces abyssalis]|uniref:SDR family NAD(P)-dependent oxidoreductase n=1 Tax=Streptomyces abyssalis TaxID=933944 RepID=A0A1E7JGS1_9ACTN|nr:SDR family NAD(P)-dependent oxidoreductase [Streptomyces abyssalis]OEU85663.1 hypothetical protein AN215_24725 [Streptomyces abyssalis]OEU92873.1 hypothetical protein DB35_13260 [Streptomyces abyssalis]